MSRKFKILDTITGLYGLMGMTPQWDEEGSKFFTVGSTKLFLRLWFPPLTLEGNHLIPETIEVQEIDEENNIIGTWTGPYFYENVFP